MHQSAFAPVLNLLLVPPAGPAWQGPVTPAVPAARSGYAPSCLLPNYNSRAVVSRTSTHTPAQTRANTNARLAPAHIGSSSFAGLAALAGLVSPSLLLSIITMPTRHCGGARRHGTSQPEDSTIGNLRDKGTSSCNTSTTHSSFRSAMQKTALEHWQRRTGRHVRVLETGELAAHIGSTRRDRAHSGSGHIHPMFSLPSSPGRSIHASQRGKWITPSSGGFA
ncbi:hypothetical protein B0T25DRAFT_539870 [Lasiosphaeria hispida]|uniref:Uncharacterized protein n=1 Tax=Lasiosphaeria hispida TaxID=260671 RepID=A0AAJ0HN76_9PEZI|nr:hypothetical protein B0T25DRAFT_539870 [Lasiosphaeria hispida]